MDTYDVDLSLLDINMPNMNGIELAKEIKRRSPDTAIIFLTAYDQYALDAIRLHVSGYILKPVIEDQFDAEVTYALSGTRRGITAHIVVKTFGGFDLFVDDEMVAFKYARSKEILAYLIDRQGSSVSRAELFSVIWEDHAYDRPMQKQLDNLIRSLRTTLTDYGIEDILEMKSGRLRIRPELISCDLYRFLKGDVDALNEYRGEYMNSYSWASMTESSLAWR